MRKRIYIFFFFPQSRYQNIFSNVLRDKLSMEILGGSYELFVIVRYRILILNIFFIVSSRKYLSFFLNYVYRYVGDMINCILSIFYVCFNCIIIIIIITMNKSQIKFSTSAIILNNIYV